MNDAALFEVTVPVFRHYLQRIDARQLKLSNDQEPLLQQALVPQGFSAAEHLETTIGFVPRPMYPLLGQEVPDLENGAVDRSGLIALISNVSALLKDTTVDDFDGAASQLVRHRAGSAELEQNATTFLTIFVLPNFFFHMGMAFAILRHEGVDIGKEDFDGRISMQRNLIFGFDSS